VEIRAPAEWKTARLRFSSGGNEHSAAPPDAEWSTNMLISRSDLVRRMPLLGALAASVALLTAACP